MVFVAKGSYYFQRHSMACLLTDEIFRLESSWASPGYLGKQIANQIPTPDLPALGMGMLQGLAKYYL